MNTHQQKMMQALLQASQAIGRANRVGSNGGNYIIVTRPSIESVMKKFDCDESVAKALMAVFINP